MSFSKCPECGETNYFENGYSVRSFDCGFKGQWDTRTARCGGLRRRRGEPAVVNDEAARYRLALLDAALVADTIAADMEVASESHTHAERCRQLAEQMRAFAGHHDLKSRKFGSDRYRGGTSANPLVAIVRRLRPW